MNNRHIEKNVSPIKFQYYSPKCKVVLCCCQQLLQKICIVFFKEKSNERNELTPCMIER